MPAFAKQTNETTPTAPVLTLREQLRRAETSSLLFAMQLRRIQPSYGCTIDPAAVARLFDQYASRESFGEADDRDGDWATTATIEAKCSAVYKSEELGLRRLTLEALEAAFNAIHYHTWWRAKRDDDLQQMAEGEDTSLSDICEEVKGEIDRLGDLLGIWINWMEGEGPNAKPSNHWKDRPAGTP